MLVSLDKHLGGRQARRHTLSAGKEPYPRDEPIMMFEPESASWSFGPTPWPALLPEGLRDSSHGERGQGKQEGQGWGCLQGPLPCARLALLGHSWALLVTIPEGRVREM